MSSACGRLHQGIDVKRPKPDHRLSWRDPNMPVLRDYRMGDGSTRHVIDPDYERRYREMLMATTSAAHFPSWRSDPTYDLRRKSKS